MKTLKLTLVFFIISLKQFSQTEDGLVKWLTIEEAQKLNKTQPKPFLIDVYTDWCGWCKHMMKTTYSNPNIAGYINQFFYPIKFNAETKDTIEYNGKIYKPTSPNPKTPHELAIKFLGNSLSYPSTIFVSNNFEYNLLSQGFLEEKKLEPLLIYTVENVFKSAAYEDFSEQFNHTFYDTTFTKKHIKTYTIKEIEKLQKSRPGVTKKILVNISAGFCNSCKVQNATTLKDTIIANYINKHFYLINFDAESNDTIMFKGEKCFKTVMNGYPLHTFALKATNNRLQFPSIAVLDTQQNTLDALNAFLTPKALLPILKYYAEDKYKTISWTDYIKAYNEQKK
jgi:thioredoxin-related protein